MSVGTAVPISLLILAITSSKFDPNSSNISVGTAVPISLLILAITSSKFKPNSLKDFSKGFDNSAMSGPFIVLDPPPLTEVLISCDILPRSKLGILGISNLGISNLGISNLLGIPAVILLKSKFFDRLLNALAAPLSIIPFARFICCSPFRTTSPGLVISSIDPTSSNILPVP